MSIYQDHPRFEESQLKRELTGLLSLSPFDPHNSSSRKQMWASHIGQTLVIKGATRRRNQTGMEDEYGKYTFSVRMPCNAQIIKIIPRYQRTLDKDSIRSSPETLIIYENVEDQTIGCLSLPEYYSHHQHFGFRYRPTQALKNLREQSFIPRDTILLDSPSVDEDGSYRFGIEANVAFMSHPATSEDGILISESFLPKLGIKMIETRVMEFGSKQWPKNKFGDATNIRPFLDIGDRVPDDGIIAVFENYDEDFAPVQQSLSAVRQVDHIFDDAVYASPGGIITDIQVWHDEESVPPSTLSGMETQLSRYDRARHEFYERIKAEYDRLHRERGEALQLTPEFHYLVVQAISVVQPNSRKVERGQPRERVTKVHRTVPMDDWRVKFVIEHDVIPTTGFKLTDGQGGKGVICAVAKECDMPIDSAGNRADVVMDPGATVSRMNLGRLFEQYINGASRDLTTELRNLLDISPKQIELGVKPRPEEIKRHPNFEHAKERLLRYYEVVTPKMGYWFGRGNPPEGNQLITTPFEELLATTLYEGIELYIPPESPVHPPSMIEIMEKEFPSTYGPVEYVGFSGRRCKTKYPVRIASFYMILLEKISDDWTATSSGKLQNFGVLGQINNRDKYSQPTRNQAIRAWGETEIRIGQAYAGPIAAAEILDRNNSIETHNQMLTAVYSSATPTNIPLSVDRTTNPLGGARPMQLIKHYLFCGGLELLYQPFDPNASSGLTEHEPGAID